MGRYEPMMRVPVAMNSQRMREAYPEIFDLPGALLVPKPHLRHRHLLLHEVFPAGSLDNFCSRHAKLQGSLAEAWEGGEAHFH